MGGECDRFSPPAAAICNPNATGGGYNWDGPGPFFPTGLELGNASTLFPNSARWKGADLSQALFTSWCGINTFFRRHFMLKTEHLAKTGSGQNVLKVDQKAILQDEWLVHVPLRSARHRRWRWRCRQRCHRSIRRRVKVWAAWRYARRARLALSRRRGSGRHEDLHWGCSRH